MPLMMAVLVAVEDYRLRGPSQNPYFEWLRTHPIRLAYAQLAAATGLSAEFIQILATHSHKRFSSDGPA
jgi:hypothetical protein